MHRRASQRFTLLEEHERSVETVDQLEGDGRGEAREAGVVVQLARRAVLLQPGPAVLHCLLEEVGHDGVPGEGARRAV